MATTPSTRAKVFISYSQADKEWLERLKRHLKPLIREGQLELQKGHGHIPEAYREYGRVLSDIRLSIRLLLFFFALAGFAFPVPLDTWFPYPAYYRS